MQQSIDIAISFLCRKSHSNSEGKNPIVLRINYRGERKDIFTGLYCYHANWITGIGRVGKSEKQSSAINKNIELIEHNSKSCFDKFRYSTDKFTLDELVNKIKGKDEPPETLLEYLDERIVEYGERVTIDITKATHYKHKRIKKYLEEFLIIKFKVKNISISRIDTKLLMQFFQFLRNDKGYEHNSALGLMNSLKATMRIAIKNGLIKSNPFCELKLQLKPVYRDYLTKEEIEKIEKLENLSDPITRTRDIFLFACYTGLACTDIQQIQRHNIILENDGSFHINKPRQKTGIISIIPMLEPAARILKKYSITEDLRDFRWQVPSNQKLNFNLKVIGEIAELKKPLHMHLARHTFATTVTLSNGVPLETVSKMLGHSSTKITQHYAKVVATKVKMDMERVRLIFS